MTWRVFLPDLTTYECEYGPNASEVPVGTFILRLIISQDYWLKCCALGDEFCWLVPENIPAHIKALNLLL